MYSSGKNTHRKHSEGGGSFKKSKQQKKKKFGKFPGQTFCFILSKPIRSLNHLLSHLVTAPSWTVKATQHSREKALVLFFALLVSKSSPVLFYAAAAIDYKLTVASGFLSHLKLACSYQLIVLNRCWFAPEYSVQIFRLEFFQYGSVRIHTWNLGEQAASQGR